MIHQYPVLESTTGTGKLSAEKIFPAAISYYREAHSRTVLKLLHDNAWNLQSWWTIRKTNRLSTLAHPPYSPDLAPWVCIGSTNVLLLTSYNNLSSPNSNTARLTKWSETMRIFDIQPDLLWHKFDWECIPILRTKVVRQNMPLHWPWKNNIITLL